MVALQKSQQRGRILALTLEDGSSASSSVGMADRKAMLQAQRASMMKIMLPNRCALSILWDVEESCAHVLSCLMR